MARCRRASVSSMPRSYPRSVDKSTGMGVVGNREESPKALVPSASEASHERGTRGKFGNLTACRCHAAVGSNCQKGPMDKSQPTLADLIDLRLDRRGLIRGAAALAAASPFAAVAQEAGPSSLTFKELAHTLDDKQHVADGYDMQVLIRWGDPVMADAPAFNAANQTAAAQEKQFGYNNDYLGLYPLPYGSKGADRFLLVANHEYVNPNLMFAGLGSGRDSNLKASKEQAEVLM